MCLYNNLIVNPKYKPNKKNGGIIPAVNDVRTLFVPIGCGQCIECRTKKAREWQVRLSEDIRHNKNGKFITLTFSDESIAKLKSKSEHKENQFGDLEQLSGYNLDNAIATKATRLFLERWRKKYKRSLRHWFVTEIGHQGTENIHIHGIIWTNEPLEEVESKWGYGFVWKGKDNNGKLINYVNEETAGYITKYLHKTDDVHPNYKSIVLTSPGIGAGYIERSDWHNNKFKGKKTDETYRTRSGHKISLPIYYRNKIYSDQEKEQLWIIKLNREERWVMGERVDVSKHERQYWMIRDYYREKNRRLGYGDGKKDYDQIAYENARRKIMVATRIAKAQERENRKAIKEGKEPPYLVKQPDSCTNTRTKHTYIERQAYSAWHPLDNWE